MTAPEHVAALRAWLATYSGMMVSRYDAQSLVDYLIKAGWTTPADNKGAPTNAD